MIAANRHGPDDPAEAPVPEGAAQRVLVVCADVGRAASLARALGGRGCAVDVVASGAAALAAVCDRPPDVILCDTALPGQACGEVLRALRAIQAEGRFCYVVALVGRGAIGTCGVGALEAGADDILVRPVTAAALEARLTVGVRLAILSRQLRQGTDAVRQTMDRLERSQALMEADLAEARRLQQGLVSERSAQFGPFHVSLLLRPSGHVGGDLVGFFPINARRVGLYAIDVSGSGVASALLTARLAAHLSGSAGQNVALFTNEFDLYDARPPVEVARRFNRMMCDELHTEAYFTMVYVDLDTVSGEARLVQAGHPHPLRQRRDGGIDPIGTGGLPIGLIDDATFEEVRVTLGPGERLFIASDGITEAADPQGVLLAQEGLEAILQTNASLRGTPLLESLCWSVGQFTRGERTDDISAVLIEREG